MIEYFIITPNTLISFFWFGIKMNILFLIIQLITSVLILFKQPHDDLNKYAIFMSLRSDEIKKKSFYLRLINRFTFFMPMYQVYTSVLFVLGLLFYKQDKFIKSTKLVDNIEIIRLVNYNK